MALTGAALRALRAGRRITGVARATITGGLPGALATTVHLRAAARGGR